MDIARDIYDDIEVTYRRLRETPEYRQHLEKVLMHAIVTAVERKIARVIEEVPVEDLVPKATPEL